MRGCRRMTINSQRIGLAGERTHSVQTESSTEFRLSEHERRIDLIESTVREMSSALTTHRIDTHRDIAQVSSKIDQVSASLRTLGWVAALIGPVLASLIGFAASRIFGGH